MNRNLFKVVVAAAISSGAIWTSALYTTPARAVVLQEKQNKQPSHSTEVFLQETLQDSLFEVKAGELAKERGSSQAVKDFGQTLVTDHGAAITQVKAIAADHSYTLKEEITPKQQKMYDMLAGKSGEEFDKEFASHMVKGHEGAIKKTEEAAKSTDDPKVKDLADKLLVKYKEHLETAKSIEKSAK